MFQAIQENLQCSLQLGLDETTLETACSSEMNIHLRHLWLCVDETVHFRGALQGLSTCTLGFPPGQEHIKPTNGDTTLTVKPSWANQKTGETLL